MAYTCNTCTALLSSESYLFCGPSDPTAGRFDGAPKTVGGPFQKYDPVHCGMYIPLSDDKHRKV